MDSGVETVRAVEPLKKNTVGEQDWKQSLLSFGFQIGSTRSPQRRYNVIRRMDGISFTQYSVAANMATRMKKAYRSEGFRVDLIEVGT